MNKADKTSIPDKRIKLSKKDMEKLHEILKSNEADKNLSEAFSNYNETFK